MFKKKTNNKKLTKQFFFFVLQQNCLFAYFKEGYNFDGKETCEVLMLSHRFHGHWPHTPLMVFAFTGETVTRCPRGWPQSTHLVIFLDKTENG